jgi:hypothetical protein
VNSAASSDSANSVASSISVNAAPARVAKLPIQQGFHPAVHLSLCLAELTQQPVEILSILIARAQGIANRRDRLHQPPQFVVPAPIRGTDRLGQPGHPLALKLIISPKRSRNEDSRTTITPNPNAVTNPSTPTGISLIGPHPSPRRSESRFQSK